MLGIPDNSCGCLFDLDGVLTQTARVVARREGLAGKPAPDIYLYAARQLGIAPADGIVYEDALAGVAAGRAGHFGFAVGVDRAGQAPELRAAGAGIVVKGLAELLDER